MKILILNGEMRNENTAFNEYLEKLTAKLSENNNVEHLHLKDMNLHYCIGCWTCWWQTPGKCVTKDDIEIILKAIVNSDFMILASPLKAGFLTSLLKKVNDRMVTLAMPYIEIVNNECHHVKRYDKLPNFGILLEKEPTTDEEDFKIIDEIYNRFSLNFRNTKKYIKFIDEYKIEDIAYETCSN